MAKKDKGGNSFSRFMRASAGEQNKAFKRIIERSIREQNKVIEAAAKLSKKDK